MENRISILTLGVSDLNYMADWYSEMFGWIAIRKQQGAVLFRLDGIMFALISQTQLARDYCAWDEERATRKFALTIGFNSKKEVDKKFHALQNKGVVAIRKPGKTPGGSYNASICDPEGNFLELAFHPELEIVRTGISIKENLYE